MAQKEQFDQGGSLYEEMQEIERLFSERENQSYSTATVNCGAILTIYCC